MPTLQCRICELLKWTLDAWACVLGRQYTHNCMNSHLHEDCKSKLYMFLVNFKHVQQQNYTSVEEYIVSLFTSALLQNKQECTTWIQTPLGCVIFYHRSLQTCTLVNLNMSVKNIKNVTDMIDIITSGAWNWFTNSVCGISYRHPLSGSLINEAKLIITMDYQLWLYVTKWVKWPFPVTNFLTSSKYLILCCMCITVERTGFL